MSIVGLSTPRVPNSAPLEYTSEFSSSAGHSVQFYEDDSFLLDGLSRYIGAALVAGDSALVIATQNHRDGLCERLQAGGLDLAKAMDEVKSPMYATGVGLVIKGLVDFEKRKRKMKGLVVEVEADESHFVGEQ